MHIVMYPHYVRCAFGLADSACVQKCEGIRTARQCSVAGVTRPEGVCVRFIMALIWMKGFFG
jgi:hypothetical protein